MEAVNEPRTDAAVEGWMRLAALVLVFLASACGGDDHAVYCRHRDVGTCVELSWSGSGLSEDKVRSQCTQGMGEDVPSCRGAVGGCKSTATSDRGTATMIVWLYNGTASDVMKLCESYGTTFVSP
jgi:hypothetical protein